MTNNPNQALWQKGDFTQIAALMRTSGAAVVQSLRIAPPLRALDLGCGDGTTAVPLAQAGADVLGVDIAENLVAKGQARAASLGLGERLRFRHGDACQLHGIEDHTFDLVLTMFGAMFAPRPLDVAKEMVRVTKPGGRIVMGNWIPDDPTSFVSQLLRICSAFVPPPPLGFESPMKWGVEAHIHERFAAAGVPKERITTMRDTYTFANDELGPDELIARFRRFYGPTMNAFDAAAAGGREAELEQQLLALAHTQNRAAGRGTAIPATFLRVIVRR